MEPEKDILGNGEVPDFELRRALLARLEADPEGYEANRDFGLYCASRRALAVYAEPYLLKALDCGRGDGNDDQELLVALAEVYKLQGRYDEARATFEDLRRRFPNTINFMFAAGDLEYVDGRIADASAEYERGTAALSVLSRQTAARESRADLRVLDPAHVIYSHIGETAHKLDLFVKARGLGLIEPFDAIVLAPSDKVANRALMDCYREHVTVIDDPDAAAALATSSAAGHHFVDYLKVPSGLTLHRELAYGVVQRMWSDRGLKAPIRISDEVMERGRETLRRLGVPDGAWFAALHVREPGFFQEDHAWSLNEYRNARIEDHLPAIEAIVARGGWVLRMGDPTMTPLPPMEGVIDYALSDARADWMDVFGMSQCRFFVGVASGPLNVARAFCVPSVATDFFPVGTWPFSAGDVFIHKLYRSTGDGRWLSLAEVLKPPMFACWNPSVYERCGVEVIDNSPEDIRDAVVEMMDALDGTAPRPSAEDAALQKRYRFAADPFNLGFLLPVSPAFLRRHPHLLGDG